MGDSTWRDRIRHQWCRRHGHRAVVIEERTPWITCRRCGAAWWLANEPFETSPPPSGLDKVRPLVRAARGGYDAPTPPRFYA